MNFRNLAALTILLTGISTTSHGTEGGEAYPMEISFRIGHASARAESERDMAAARLMEAARLIPGWDRDSFLVSIEAAAAAINAAFHNDGDAHGACGSGRKNVDGYGATAAQILRGIVDGLVHAHRREEAEMVAERFRSSITKTEYKNCTMTTGIEQCVANVRDYALSLRRGVPINPDNLLISVSGAAAAINAAFHNDGDAHGACGSGRKNVDGYGVAAAQVLRGIVDGLVLTHRYEEAKSVKDLFRGNISKTEYKNCTMTGGITKAATDIDTYAGSAVAKAEAEENLTRVREQAAAQLAEQRAIVAAGLAAASAVSVAEAAAARAATEAANMEREAITQRAARLEADLAAARRESEELRAAARTRERHASPTPSRSAPTVDAARSSSRPRTPGRVRFNDSAAAGAAADASNS